MPTREKLGLIGRLVGLSLGLLLEGGLPSAVLAEGGYRLGPNDVIRIQVFGEEDLTVEGKVGDDGTMNFPLLGVIQIAGYTVDELRDDLTVRLAKGYIRQPKVTVYITRYRNFYVGGEVKTPGGYPYEGGLTVHQAISVAGGMTDKAGEGKIRVTRVIAGLAQTFDVERDALVLPDDFIVVARIQKVYVNGEVKKPGDYSYEHGLTVHKAITMAGGFTDKAAEGRTKVLRIVNGKEHSLRVKLNDPVLPEDIIVVPQSLF